jgi:hypothetical protein
VEVFPTGVGLDGILPYRSLRRRGLAFQRKTALFAQFLRSLKNFRRGKKKETVSFLGCPFCGKNGQFYKISRLEAKYLTGNRAPRRVWRDTGPVLSVTRQNFPQLLKSHLLTSLVRIAVSMADPIFSLSNSEMVFDLVMGRVRIFVMSKRSSGLRKLIKSKSDGLREKRQKPSRNSRSDGPEQMLGES